MFRVQHCVVEGADRGLQDERLVDRAAVPPPAPAMQSPVAESHPARG
jgi:hypothetical protein